MSRKTPLLAIGVCWLVIGPAAVLVEGQTKKIDFGFSAAFEEEVGKIGQISPDEFARRYPLKGEYLAKFGWDPASAQYFDLFQLDPGDPKAMKPIRNLKPGDIGLYDFRLKDRELGVLKQHGFVVSERLGSHSFTDLYYRLYVRDLPVFVSSDSMLHAWHRFFDTLLESLEHNYFHPEFEQMLEKMAAQIPAAQKDYGSGPLAASVEDVDLFLAVARGLLAGKGSQSKLGRQQDLIDATLTACFDQKMQEFPLFGRVRTIDFSQFKPRGRYDRTPQDANYFRAVMWLGRIDFRIAGGETPEQDLRELGGAIVLNDLLHRADVHKRWQQVDRSLLHLIGKSDSLNFSQLGEVLASARIKPNEVTRQVLSDLRQRILDSDIGEQHIRGEWFILDHTDPKKFVLPRTFCFMGQRFILDSFVLSKIVYDDIIWNKEKLQRRIPSCLDVGFAVLGNDHLVPILTERMKEKNGRRLRDGLNYQHNLAAVRNVIDRLPAGMWTESVYADWMSCLRELSRPTTDAKYPQAMRGQAWALKSAATQFASWTQLRHDTVLYAKPSYSGGNLCSYPAGFVEPLPEFWKRYGDMVERTKAIVSRMAFPDVGQYKGVGEFFRGLHLKNLEKFSDAAGMLRSIAEKELAQQELTEAQTKFLKFIVVHGGGSGMPPVSGWYPQLFSQRSQHKSEDDAHKWVALVTDVHTDPPSPIARDPGCVLHQGVGNVDCLLIAVDNGKERMLFAGPVFSHYEFEAPNAVRLTNAQWHENLREGKGPTRPEWTSSFVVPGPNPTVKSYGKTGG